MSTQVPVESERWALVTRVADSSHFRKSPRLREFLLYACECALHDRSEDLREQSIGWKVFNRRADYNPGEDNIVRVEARKLRQRLQEHFASEGCDEPVLIEIPKGAYVPVFLPRTKTSTVESPAAIVLPNSPWAAKWIQPVLILALALACMLLWNRERTTGQRTTAARNALWTTLFNADQDTTIVCADSTLVLVQNLAHRSVTLPEYTSRTYLSTLANAPELAAAIPLLTRQYTSMADVHLVEKMLLLNYPAWGRTQVRNARNMQLSDFKRGNFVMIGSKRAIPWNELFDSRLHFRFEFSETSQVWVIHNDSPQAGEQSQYVNTKAGDAGDVYSSVALVPNLSSTGYVLIINGTTMEATEAAGEYIANPMFCARLLKTLGFQPDSKIGMFEVLLKSNSLAGGSSGSNVVGYRILQSEPIRY